MKIFRSSTSWFAALALATTPAVFAEDDNKDKNDNDKAEGTIEVRESSESGDSTTRSTKDSTDVAVTVMDQDDSEASVERTTAIRRAVMDEDDLSMSAKNAQIITVEGGDVHLHGEVKNAEEKAKIEALARTAGAENIHNHLEVKSED